MISTDYFFCRFSGIKNKTRIKNAGSLIFGGEEGIRTLVELPPNGFQARLVMTASIPLQKNGAANRSRTDDLILTKDVLYQLSHSSISFFIPSGFEFLSLVPDDYIIIAREVEFVNTFFKKIEKIFKYFFTAHKPYYKAIYRVLVHRQGA